MDSVTQIEVDFVIPAPKHDGLTVDAAGIVVENNEIHAHEILLIQDGPWYKPAPQDDAPAIRLEPGVTSPLVIFRVEPRYTPEARAARYQGTVVVEATIHQDGTPTVGRNAHSGSCTAGTRPRPDAGSDRGIGKQWKFKPGMKDGNAVPVKLNIEVNFHLK